MKTGALARHELVVAAHTTLVVAAFFEVLRDWLDEVYDEAKFTKAEKVMLATGKRPAAGQSLVRHLYTAEVPSPSALRGFEENVQAVGRWAVDTIGSVIDFFGRSGFRPQVDVILFTGEVARRYRSDYLRLATTVHEFKVWADLTEHAATRSSLARLEALLSQSTRSSVRGDLRALLGELNRAELTRPVIDVDIDGYGIGAVFPTVERIFLTPRFRGAWASREARIGDESWWADIELRHDLDAVLARHFSTAAATRLPLLLLGHPGAGKSLLMKVLAARLPQDTYTVVRVPLRRVDADANVSAQIQQALAVATHDRVHWSTLVDQSADTIRVILLDGLDELLQATANDRAGYLTDIVEFQRVEAAMGKPVAVVVTSRTLVAERVRVPVATPVLKLEEFDDEQIRDWVEIWHEVNAGARPVPLDVLMAQEELARQPLLLLMLTLYFADPDVATTGAHMSKVDLYERIFDTYARREVTKQVDRVLPVDELAEKVRSHLSRLSIAAFGMFNRGRQWITEAELSADLAALGEPAPVVGRLLGEFFFVHAPEATAGEVQRGYEFLHATFAEYLVTTMVAEVLVDVAEGAFGRRRFHEPDDDLLFALLSHQPLAVQRPILVFLFNHFEAMASADRTHAMQTLELLIRGYRHRRSGSRYLNYRPLPFDSVRALAAYSANLVLLRGVADPAGVELTTLWSDDVNMWPATVNLWAGGLDVSGYRAVLTSLDRVGSSLVTKGSSRRDVVKLDEFNAAYLRGDPDTAHRLQYGHAVFDDFTYFDRKSPHTWRDTALAEMLRVAMSRSPRWYVEAPSAISVEVMSELSEVAMGALGVYCVLWDAGQTEQFALWLLGLRDPSTSLALPLALAEHVHPGLLDRVLNQLDGPSSDDWRAILRAIISGYPQESGIAAVADYLRQVVPSEWPVRRPRQHDE